MRRLGLDIGSRSVEAVWVDEGGTVIDALVADSGYDPIGAAMKLVGAHEYDSLVATGYGRRAAADALRCDVITEIKAYGIGAHASVPTGRSILDIGGQDTKAILLGNEGKIIDFEMNDKCAAGTGKFLEVMARALGFKLPGLAHAALSVSTGVAISSMCTVFAESEVTGLVHRGEDRAAIARGIHEAIAKRTVSMLRRTGVAGPLVFAGGVANNRALVELIGNELDMEVIVPKDPQIIGAYGAALSAVA